MNTALGLAALLALGISSFDVSAQQSHALAVARAVERLSAARTYWPGYDPLKIPLAVFDGQRTFLFRHPAPPEGFSPLAGAKPAAHTYQGRHPAVTSNSSAEIGGVVTATVLADGPRARLTASELAAVSLHEAFHVFQRRRHPGWSGNEGDLLLYPTDDARLLTLRRLETAALRKALADAGSANRACWARRAMAVRAERFAAMDSAFVAYERLTELNEGLAQYIQMRASGRTRVVFPAAEFGAGEVRLRAYTVGPALGLLLDRFAPDWKQSLESNDRQSLDELLRAALERGAGPRVSCGFSTSETANVERTARADAAAILSGRAGRRRAFDAHTGWRLVIQAADGHPLWPQGFDPLNVERIEGGLLHTRFLRVGNESGQVTVIDEEGADIEALSEGIGPHPLFNGVRRAVIAGVREPEVQVDSIAARVSIRMPGVTADFRGATVRRVREEVIVELRAP